MGQRTRQSFINFLARLTIVAMLAWLLQPLGTAQALSIRAVLSQDPGFLSVIFDANLATTTVTANKFTLNAGTPSVASVMTAPDALNIAFVSASGTVALGETVTVSSTVTDTGNATNTTTGARTVTAPIKIAAVRAAGTGNNLDEYIELYNARGTTFAAGTSTLFLHVINPSGESNVPLSFVTSTIPDHGFFLIASAGSYSGGIAPDATYATSADLIATSTTAIYISTSATTNVGVLDKVEWGPSAQIVNTITPTSSFANTVAAANLTATKVVMRKASNLSSSSTMKSGGTEVNKGNSYDTRSNSADFVVLDPAASQTAVIKNSASPKEFPFGGGQSDTSAPIVMGSFPSGTAGEMVPTDLQFIGLGFNKPIDAATFNSSTVRLVVQGQNTNLCTSVTYNNSTTNGPPGQCNISGGLTAGTTYVFTVKGSSSTPNVQDFSSNPVFQPAGSNMGQHGNANHDYEVTFSPASGLTFTPQTPPNIIGSYPSGGNSGIPTDIAKVAISFSQAMNLASMSGITLRAGGSGSNLLTNASAALSADSMSVSIPLSGALIGATSYTLTIPTTVKNSNNVFLPMSRTVQFTTGAGGDSTGPTVLGKLPNIATGVPVNAIDIHVSTDDPLDISTITSSTVQVTDAASNVFPGTVSYDPVAREILWLGNNVFQTNTAYTVSLSAVSANPKIQNVSGVALQDTDGSANNKYQFTFTTSASADSTGPGILFANANTFSVAVTFDEAVKSTEAATIGNYALTSGGNSVSLSSFNGNTVSYDAGKHTAIINGVNLTAGATFAITASNIHDLSNNSLDPTKVSFSGTVQSGSQNGGQIGVGGGYIPPTGGIPTGFATSTFGFMPEAEVRPFNSLAGFTSNYSVNLPISTQIPASGKITLSFPSSFTLANVSLDTFSPANGDINGPGTGTVTIASVAGNDTAHTVTVTLGAVATRGGLDTHDFLHFDLAGIGNSPVPTSNGYTVDLRTLNGTTTLESITAKPFFISAAGTGNLTVSLTATGATNGTTTVYLFSPVTGPLASSTTAFSGGFATTTFASIPTGQFNLATNPIIALTGGTFLGQATPLPITVGASTQTSLTLAAASSLASTTVNIHATAAGKKVSVFAGGSSGGFVDIPTTTVNGTTSVVLYYPADGNYMLGVGPQMNKTFMGPPPAPDYVMPQPQQITVTGSLATATTVNFDLISAALTITGTLTDENGKIVANANVFAFSPQGGFGTFGQSGSDGSFRLNVGPGSYKVGANAPGFPSSQEISVVVNSTGQLFVSGSATASASVILKLSKPSGTSITGKVTDGTNAISGAQVWAYCDGSTSGNTCFGPNGHAEAQTDSSGNFTLYVGNGTWKVGAFIPGYGQQPETSVVVSGASASVPDIRPSATGSFKSVAGTVCTNTGSTCSGGTGVSGAGVRIEGTDPSGNFYSNSVQSASDGTYSFSSIPSGLGASYRVRGFAPGLGDLPLTAAFGVNASNITGKDLVVKAGRSLSINLVSPPSTYDVFIDFTNTTNGSRNFMSLKNNASGTIQVPNGSTYTIGAHAPGFGLSATNLAKVSGTATYSTSTGALDLTSGSDTVVLNLTFPSSTPISGTVKDNNLALIANAWVDINNSTGLHFGTQANASGTYSLALQDGTYSIASYAPGYLPSGKSLTLASGVITLGSATTTTSSVNLTMTKSAINISGTITAGGNAAANALVKATSAGGGSTVALADANGVYSLPIGGGNWTVSAVADGYQEAAYASNPVIVSGSSISNINISLSTRVSLAAPTAQSITPAQGGSLRNESGRLEVTIPANALGSSANSGQIKATETSNVIATGTARPIGKGQDIRAYDSSNNSINTLNSNVTISLEVPSTDFASNNITGTASAAKLKIGYFDTSLSDWVPIATTISYENSSDVPVTPNATLSNVDHITLTGPSSHFSVFGAITPTDSVVPSAPSHIDTTAISGNLVITWTAPTTNSDGSALTDLMEFEIYRDTDAAGNFTTQLNTSQVASGTLTYTDSSVTAGSTYYYKLAAADTSGNESAKSAAVRGSATGGSGGTVSGSTGGGGGGGGSSGSTPITTTPAPTTVTTPAPAAAAPQTGIGSVASQALAAKVKTTLTRPIEIGARGTGVTLLQQLLSQDSSIYPEGTVSGYFGKLTRTAVQKFQLKYKVVVSTSDTGYGVVGPKTRAKLIEIFGQAATSATVPAAPAATPPAAATPTPAPVATVKPGATIGELTAQLLQLQAQLQEMLTKLKKP